MEMAAALADRFNEASAIQLRKDIVAQAFTNLWLATLQ